MPEAMREDPTLLAGEHVHRDLFAEDPELAPWAEAADILAEHRWPRLYDEQALRGAEVPGAAAVYYDDAYVPREHSMATAALLPHLRTWVTSEYEHNGLRASGEAVLDHLLDLAAGRRAA
jgi:pimeloyl-ACP methyl ester carboxylesterase